MIHTYIHTHTHTNIDAGVGFEQVPLHEYFGARVCSFSRSGDGHYEVCVFTTIMKFVSMYIYIYIYICLCMHPCTHIFEYGRFQDLEAVVMKCVYVYMCLHTYI